MAGRDSGPRRSPQGTTNTWIAARNPKRGDNPPDGGQWEGLVLWGQGAAHRKQGDLMQAVGAHEEDGRVPCTGLQGAPNTGGDRS